MINLEERYTRYIGNAHPDVERVELNDIKRAFYAGAFEMGQSIREASNPNEFTALCDELASTLATLAEDDSPRSN